MKNFLVSVRIFTLAFVWLNAPQRCHRLICHAARYDRCSRSCELENRCRWIWLLINSLPYGNELETVTCKRCSALGRYYPTNGWAMIEIILLAIYNIAILSLPQAIIASERAKPSIIGVHAAQKPKVYRSFFFGLFCWNQIMITFVFFFGSPKDQMKLIKWPVNISVAMIIELVSVS